MTRLYVHYSWFIFLILLTLLSFCISLYISFTSSSIFFSFPLFNIVNIDLSVSFFFDFISIWFFSIVLFISITIIIYSFFYISPYSKSVYFLWLTILFVLSILIVISINNLIFIILGWDGLGLVSFFLIVFYQNQTSLTSGYFTLLINRIGDSFFLVSIIFFIYYRSDLDTFCFYYPSLFRILFLVITFITKRALFPFSPWLPAAIAAPTPISALVHSSTLVTAGLFLMIRFSYFIYSSPYICSFLRVICLFTSFYAGINTIFEKDLKKLIALSTLRHLGFIGFSFSLGLIYFAFFHILTHALFKSLLFITIGDIIININHSQDIRYLSLGNVYTPFSSLVIMVSLLNLLGLPTLSGYFSKDLVLESFNYSNSSFFLYIILFTNVFFTYYYTYQLFYFSFQSNKLVPYQQFHNQSKLHCLLIIILSLFSICFGTFYINSIYSSILFLCVPISLKFLPLLINISFFFFLVIFIYLFRSNNLFLNYYFSTIIFITPLIKTVVSNFFLSRSFILNKRLESGLFNYILNIYPSLLSSFISSQNITITLLHPLKLILFIIPLFFLFY